MGPLPLILSFVHLNAWKCLQGAKQYSRHQEYLEHDGPSPSLILAEETDHKQICAQCPVVKRAVTKTKMWKGVRE